jgi:hypothetical protein
VTTQTANFFIVVERNEIGPSFARHRALRAGLPLDRPPDPLKLPVPAEHECLANCSCCLERNAQEAGTLFAVVETVGYNTKRKSLDFRDRFVAGGPVFHRAGKLNDFGDPAAIGLLLDFNPKRHRCSGLIGCREIYV